MWWYVKVPSLPSRAVLQLVLCFSTLVFGIARVAITNHRLVQLSWCSSSLIAAMWGLFSISYLNCSLLVLLQTPATGNIQKQHWIMVGCYDPFSLITQYICAPLSFLFSFSLLLPCISRSEGIGHSTKGAVSTSSRLQGCRVPGGAQLFQGSWGSF